MNKLTTPVIFTISLFLFIFGISSQEIISFDSRFYLFALEMWQDGPTWFPTTYHQPYPDYTSASTFMIYLCSLLFGGVSKFTAVLPTAIAASLTIVMTYKIAALHDKRWGLSAVCFMLLTITFFKSARGIALDMYPALFTTICFYLVYSADVLRKPSRVRWVYLFILLSFIFRGPIGLVIPVGVVCAYYLTEKKWKQFFIVGILSTIILIAASTLLAALAYHVGGNDFLQDVLRMQVVGRLNEKHLPFYFYFTNGLANYALSFPFALIVLLSGIYTYLAADRVTDPLTDRLASLSRHALSRDASRSQEQFRPERDKAFCALTLIKFLAWMLVIMIGLSIPGEKKTRYILAATPAFALIASYPFLNKISVKNVKLLIATVVMFVITMLTVVEPIELSHDRARDLVQMIETKRKQAHADLVFYQQNHDGMPIKYLMNMPQEEMPVFIDNEIELFAYKKPAFFITREESFDALPAKMKAHYQVVVRGDLGHVAVVVFRHL